MGMVALSYILNRKGHGRVLVVLEGGKGWVVSAFSHVILTHTYIYTHTRPSLSSAPGEWQRADGGRLLHHASSDQQFQRGNP